MPEKDRFEAEITALQEALDVLETSAEGLRLALRHLARGAREASEPPLMPNYARAEEQLRTALNATGGAARSVQRRLDMRRKARTAHTRRREAEAE